MVRDENIKTGTLDIFIDLARAVRDERVASAKRMRDAQRKTF